VKRSTQEVHHGGDIKRDSKKHTWSKEYHRKVPEGVTKGGLVERAAGLPGRGLLDPASSG
jgi:hypothetical protein